MNVHTIRIAALNSLLCMVCCMLLSCNSIIYDEERDCSVHYLVRFKYDYNMKYADAFAHEVDAVTLFLIDSEGNIVWQKTEQGTQVAQTGYTMEVEALPGKYTMMAWCEKKSDAPAYHYAIGNNVSTSFVSLADAQEQQTAQQSNTELRNLFYGLIEDVELPQADEGTYIYEMPLVKDNNHITINLMQTGGQALQPEDIQMQITDGNAALGCDNMPTTQADVIYQPWHQCAITTLPDEVTRTDDYYSGVSAEFTTLRLLCNHAASSCLTVTLKKTQQTILSLRLIDALLLVKGYYNRQMEAQEYLDRQDVYNLTFFLDERGQWIDTSIIINGWRVVLQNTDLK